MIKLFIKNKLSIITALAILYLSFARADTFDKVDVFNFPHIDKVVHFCMYFGLMLMLQMENNIYAKKIRNLIVLSLISLLYGIAIEFGQSWFTTTRHGDFFDALFDFFGILGAIGAWKLYIRFLTKRTHKSDNLS
jgi:VanZ family protein